ncbi:hypothetical protein HMPREF1986_02211 [Oribacterium sp. oral taxon 078 str. F0263]|nr:hypothetical protein HMPREF1986_02211 [Oribacterium sp. oral taxon 078 str. F0263]
MEVERVRGYRRQNAAERVRKSSDSYKKGVRERGAGEKVKSKKARK